MNLPNKITFDLKLSIMTNLEKEVIDLDIIIIIVMLCWMIMKKKVVFTFLNRMMLLIQEIHYPIHTKQLKI